MILVLCNVFLIPAAVAGSVIYANNVRASQIETKEQDFISTVESMKSVSRNYLDSERGYAENWAASYPANSVFIQKCIDKTEV